MKCIIRTLFGQIMNWITIWQFPLKVVLIDSRAIQLNCYKKREKRKGDRPECHTWLTFYYIVFTMSRNFVLLQRKEGARQDFFSSMLFSISPQQPRPIFSLNSVPSYLLAWLFSGYLFSIR